ncbi:MAG: hypothetical protein AB8H80_06810 [Planctomycetota bacterium]
MTRSTPTVAALVTAAVVLTSVRGQNAVTLQPVQDTTLYEDATGARANGSGGRVFVGLNSQGLTRRAILQFDVAGALPAGAVILTADLDLFVEQSSATGVDLAFAHRVTASWQEGSVVAPGSGGGGGPSVAGESTWLHRDFPAVLWGNPGGDFEPVASFSFGMPLSGAASSGPSQNLVEDLDYWLANPGNNHGWLLKTDEANAGTARRIRSRESSNAPPSLTITFLLPGEVAAFGGDGCDVNGAPFSLGLSGSATGGQSVAFAYSSGTPNGIGASYFSLDLDVVGTPLFAGCLQYLPMGQPVIAGSLFLTDAAGAANSALALPPNAPGFLVVVQGAVVVPTALGFALSNAGVMLTQ